MAEESKEDKLAKHLERIINNLNQHWHSIQLLLGTVSKPLIVDNRNLKQAFAFISYKVDEMVSKINELIDQLKMLDLTQTFGEIKYIGKRLNEIEDYIEEIRNHGIRKNVHLDITLDGDKLDSRKLDQPPTDYLRKLLETLTEREQKCLIHRYGLLGEKAKTFEAIGKIFQVGRERIRQIIAKSLRKCRQPQRIDLVRKMNGYPDLKVEILGDID